MHELLTESMDIALWEVRVRGTHKAKSVHNLCVLSKSSQYREGKMGNGQMDSAEAEGAGYHLKLGKKKNGDGLGMGL